MKFHLPIRLSIAWKFILTLSLVIIMLGPVSAYLYISQSLRVLNAEAAQTELILKENLRDKGLSIAGNIAMNISSAVAGSDYTFLQNIIETTVRADKAIRFGIILNKAGMALVHSDPAKVLQTLSEPQDLKSQRIQGPSVFEYPVGDEDILEVAIPILLGEERWGTLRIGHTLRYLNDEIRKSQERAKGEVRKLTQTALIITVVSLVFATLLALVFSRHIVRAIRAVVAATQNVARGDFQSRVNIKTGDELQTLGEAINTMAGDLDTLQKEVVQKARMESELHTAELVQKKIMPKEDPKYPSLELASFFRSASETGGDWFTYSLQPDGETLSIIIADVTGHGLPAALLTEAAHSCFQTINALSPHMAPSDTLRMLNRVLIPHMDKQFGMTAFVSNVHLPTLKIVHSNAGHNMPLLYDTGNGSNEKHRFQVLSTRGVRLGGQVEDRFEEQTMQLKPETLLFWYTDGLLDCENAQGEQFGKKRLLRLLREYGKQSSDTIRDSLVSDIKQFIGDTPLPDDITLIIGKTLSVS